MGYAKRLSSMATQILSSGERSALRRLVLELRISRHHRNGLRQMQRMSWSRPTRINLGCGSYLKAGYLNIDFFPGGDLTLDLRRGLPFESECCDMIFSEHFFEHVDYPSPVDYILRDCLRVLRPGGTLRVSVPDTEWPLKDYPFGIDAPYFQACAEHRWHPADCSTRLEHINYHFRQRDEHRFAYDEETLKKVIQAAGFCGVKRVAFDPTIDAMHREIGSLFVTARKPHRE